ncbi:hypothetical protein D3Z53_19045 [Lachnospiraceae bacterium]|nr:hypothetical protein [Lachnospiraceae bacterium]
MSGQFLKGIAHFLKISGKTLDLYVAYTLILSSQGRAMNDEKNCFDCFMSCIALNGLTFDRNPRR